MPWITRREELLESIQTLIVSCHKGFENSWVVSAELRLESGDKEEIWNIWREKSLWRVKLRRSSFRFRFPDWNPQGVIPHVFWTSSFLCLRRHYQAPVLSLQGSYCFHSISWLTLAVLVELETLNSNIRIQMFQQQPRVSDFYCSQLSFYKGCSSILDGWPRT